MISREVLENIIFNTIKKGSCIIPLDIEAAFQKAIQDEKSALSKRSFESTFESLMMSKENCNLACPDTGWPLFFFKIGEDVKLEGGFLGLEEAAKQATARATKEGYLRSTMKHPLTGHDPGTNVGMNVPGFTYKFVPGDTFRISYAAKGGGSECFGGTRYRVVAFADGMAAIYKFVIDSYIAASRAGAICPPAVIGVGIGGTADISSKLAKQAATLRTIGSRHPEPEIAEIEENLFKALNELKIGAMGVGGETSIFAVNVEYAHTHIAGIALSMSANCFVARRATTQIYPDGSIEELENPNWFDGR